MPDTIKQKINWQWEVIKRHDAHIVSANTKAGIILSFGIGGAWSRYSSVSKFCLQKLSKCYFRIGSAYTLSNVVSSFIGSTLAKIFNNSCLFLVWHSHITRTFQPNFFNSLMAVLSRCWLRLNFFIQYSVLVLGMEALTHFK